MHKQISKNYYYKYKPIKKPLTLFISKEKEENNQYYCYYENLSKFIF